MLHLFKDVRFDWLKRRKIFMGISVLLLFAGLGSTVIRQAVPGGTDAFNLGVDFKGGTVVTVKFRKEPTIKGANVKRESIDEVLASFPQQRPTDDELRAELAAQGISEVTIRTTKVPSDVYINFLPRPTDEELRAQFAKQGIGDAVIQSTEKRDEVLIKVSRQGAGDASVSAEEVQAQVDAGSVKVKQALNAFGAEKDAYQIIGKEAVGEVAGKQLRIQAISVTLLALVGMLLYIAVRYEWTYGAAAVITVFHDVLVTLGFFSIFQWEVSLTVVAALLTLVGFSVNDTIVTFDRVRENLKLHRRDSLYKITNDAINQTLSRTVITSGLVFLSVLALVLFGGDVLRGFSIALFIGIIVGTYSTIAIASPIMVWWQLRVDASKTRLTPTAPSSGATGQPARARKAKAGGGSVAARGQRATGS